MANNLELELNTEYSVELYPTNSLIKALYVGRVGNKHNFIYEHGNEMGIAVMDNNWITERIGDGKKVLTYNLFSSSSVKKIPTGEVEGNSVISKLMFGGMAGE
jgi:hypothetical protein